MSTRQPDHPIDPLFLERWSPRAFDPAPIPEADLHSLFEAARWAPSAFNSQPWRFLYARRGDDDWPLFLSLLIPWNQGWAHAAAALVYILSDTLPFAGKDGAPAPSLTHSFDAGAAWACLALQATKLGYQAHGMSGIELERARVELRVPERFRIEAAVAVGRLGDPAALAGKLRDREVPSGRRPLAETVFHGRFPA
ncbi:MAG: nitroreductase family protein [Alphaproteobacteria bacterium]|nr:nitroreductase family protein [Alphaproteobacteria bacterium]